jgi:putative ABC transport system permease protein
MVLSLRNTFRRRARVALMLITLTLGGAMFIVVVSVGASLSNAIEILISDLGSDVLVGFDRPHPATRLVGVTESTPDVIKAEVWDYRGAMLSLVNGEECQVFVWGVPPDSEMFSPRIVSGRDLLPEDGRVILLNHRIATDEGIEVGDQVELTIAGRESVWTVVGSVINLGNLGRDNFVPFDALARELGVVNRGTMWR